MLATRTAQMTAGRRALVQSAPRVGGRRIVLRSARDDARQKVEDVKQDAAKAGDKVKDAFQNSTGDVKAAFNKANSTTGFDNDPKGVNKPGKDATDIGVANTAFAVQSDEQDAYKAGGSWLLPAFTRRREVAVGRLAIVGFAAAAFTEIYANGHPGPLAQVAWYTGLPTGTVTLGVLGFVLHGLAGVLTPTTNSRANKEDVAKRPTGLNDGVNPAKDLGGAIGTSETIGFTKKNELFNGRMAMLGFLFAIMGELRGGGGAIGQIANWIGATPSEQWFNNAGRVLVFWSLFTLISSWVNNNMGQIEGDESVY